MFVCLFQSEDPVEDVYVEYEVMSNNSSVQISDSEDEQPPVAMVTYFLSFHSLCNPVRSFSVF